MSHFEVFGLYLVLNIVLLLVLFTGVVRIRLSGDVSIGHGERSDLLQAQRAHGNFVENAPFVLIGMLSMMQLGTSSLMLHVVGATFLVGRVLHAYGITRADATNRARQIGTILTLLSLVIIVVYVAILIFQSRGSYGIT